MKKYLQVTSLLIVLLFLLGGCVVSGQQEKQLRYPRKPMHDPERKSGPAMLLYEAAEADADPGNVIVIPPDDRR